MANHKSAKTRINRQKPELKEIIKELLLTVLAEVVFVLSLRK